MAEKDQDFFVEETVSEVAEDHAEVIMAMSVKEARRIISAYEKIRRELRDRLDRMPPGTFSAQKMGATLAQLDMALNKMGKNLTTDMKSSVSSTAELGVEHLIKELQKWNSTFKGAIQPINIRSVEAVAKTQKFLFNQYDASLDSYNAVLRGQMARSLTESVIAQDSTGDVMSRLGKVLQAEQWKLEQITRTELHSIYSRGKLAGMTELWDEGEGQIPDLMKTLYHPMDSRTGEDSIRLNRNNPIVPVDEPFVEDSLGYTVKYMAPPNRPNDRAILIPYREEWAK